MFLKKTSIPNLVKSLGYIKCYGSRGSMPAKSPNLSNITVRRSENDCKDLKSYLKPEKRPIIYSFFKKNRLATERRVTGWLVLALDPRSAFLNTATTDKTFQKFRKQYSFRHILKSVVVCMKIQAYSFLEPPLEHNQD